MSFVPSSATDHTGFYFLPAMHERDQILSIANISPAVAISQPCKPYTFLICHCVVAKSVRRVGTPISPEKPDLFPLPQLLASNELVLTGE